MARRDPKPKTTSSRGGSSPRRRSPARRKRRTRGDRLALLGRLAVVAFFLGALGLLGIVGVMAYYAKDLPTTQAMRDYDPPQTTRVLDRKGRVVGQFAEERRTVVPMERIPRVLVLSVLAAEDADFYRHDGLDYAGILRAVIRDVFGGRRQGASTITQQIIKNILLTPERTIERKLKEWILAVRIEQELSKDEILFLYLNHINFGHARYGVQEASRFYFGKDVETLTLAEASLLAGIPQAPSRLSPRSHPEAARRRQRYVLRQLERKRQEYWPDLPLEEIEQARAHPVELVEQGDDALDSAPEVLSYARRLLADQVGQQAAQRGGFTIHTTVDLALQTQARTALRKGLTAIDARHGLRGPLEPPRRKRKLERVARLRIGRTYDAVVTGADDDAGKLRLDVGGHDAVASLDDLARFNPDNLPPSRFAEKGARVRVSVLQPDAEPARVELELGPEGAVVVIDPRTRHVLALIGGAEERFGFNRAVQAVRQPGSTFKPIVYGLGIRSRRFTPASLVLDAPEVYEQWRPRNYETWHYEGAVRLREALARSINLVAVRVISEVTPAAAVGFAQELGITTDLEPSLSLALGASDVRPIELTNAYATFAAGGRWEPYQIVRRIEDPHGEEVPLPQPEAPRDVMTSAEAYVVTSMLTSVVREGTAARAQRLGRPAAGKTGTSNRARDAWFVGFTPRTVAGVWVGYDDRRPLGRRESGGKAALPIWMDVIAAAEADTKPSDFVRPSGIETALIDPESGLLAYEGMEGAIEEIFLEGTAPSETAPRPDELDANRFLMEQLGELAPQVEDMPASGSEPGSALPTARAVDKPPLSPESLLKDP